MKTAVIPPVLYLPMRTRPDGQSAPQLQDRPDGKRALLAYTALDRLASECGAEQPWVLIYTEDLQRIKQEEPFDVISFDPKISPRLRAEGRLK